MFTPEAKTAIVSLQMMALSEADAYWLERIDRAIDECVAHPERTEPPAFQRRNALANAKKVLDGRRSIRLWQSISEREANIPCSPRGEWYSIIEWYEWLRTSLNISPDNRTLLLQLADGWDAQDLANLYNQPVVAMRQRISRARSAARVARSLDIAAAEA